MTKTRLLHWQGRYSLIDAIKLGTSLSTSCEAYYVMVKNSQPVPTILTIGVMNKR